MSAQSIFDRPHHNKRHSLFSFQKVNTRFDASRVGWLLETKFMQIIKLKVLFYFGVNEWASNLSGFNIEYIEGIADNE